MFKKVADKVVGTVAVTWFMYEFAVAFYQWVWMIPPFTE